MTESTVFYSIFCITIGLALKRNYILAVAFIGASGMQSQPAGDTALDRYSADAEQAMAAHDWPAAAKALQQLAKGAPGVPEVHANLGLAYYSQNLVSEAAAEFQKTLSLDPKFPRAGWMLGLCDAELGRSEEAIKLLEPAWGHPPDDQAARLIGLDLLRAYQGLQQYGKAAMLGEDLLRRYPKDPEIVYQVSRLHAGRSYQLMKQLVQTAPDSYWVHVANAQVHESLQRYDLAQQEYRKAIELNPTAPGAHYGLGRAILGGSKDAQSIDEAMREFERELAVSPENASAEFELGEIARERGQLDVAREHLSKAVGYTPDFFEAQMGLARVLLKQRKPREAIPHLEQAVRLEPRDTLPHYLLATAHKSLGNAAAADRELNLYRTLRSSAKRAGTADDEHTEP
ncbi:MAG TPA: tetratricopeptide repeat protein [Bryobacteraceae bacterium]|nr:tetratricopeptide repeat protein [Bryobacteraceae bacterium]